MKTLTMPAQLVGIMGGPTHQEARDALVSHYGYSQEQLDDPTDDDTSGIDSDDDGTGTMVEAVDIVTSLLRDKA